MYLVKWVEQRECQIRVIASDEEAAADIVYGGDMDENDIEVISEEILEVQSVVRTDN